MVFRRKPQDPVTDVRPSGLSPALRQEGVDAADRVRRRIERHQDVYKRQVYSLSHKKLLELASEAGAIYRMDSTVLINRDIFDAYLERFHKPASKAWKGDDADER